jgi:hypothetical protein
VADRDQQGAQPCRHQRAQQARRSGAVVHGRTR